MGLSQISDAPFQDLSTCSSESVLLDIHGVVRREGNSQKRKASPCKHVCFASCLHILALHVFIYCPLELSPFRLPLRWIISPLLLFSESKLPCDKLVSLLKGVSIDTHVNLHCFACLSADSSSALLLFREAAFWQSTTVSADQICKIMRWILAMP